MSRLDRFTTTLLVLGTGACSPPTSGPDGSNLPTRMLEEDLRIGGLSDTSAALGSIGSVVPLADGGIWVLQPLEYQIHRYSADGKLVARVGRRGAGPGEITEPGVLGPWPGSRDTFWLADWGLARVSLFTIGGEFVRLFSIRPWRTYREVLDIGMPHSFAFDGSALGRGQYKTHILNPDSVPLVRYDATSDSVYRVIAWLARQEQVVLRRKGVEAGFHPHPLPIAPRVAYDLDGRRLAVIDYAVGNDAATSVLRVHLLTVDGDTIAKREYTYSAEPISREEINSILEGRIQAYMRATSAPRREVEQIYQESMLYPEHRPPMRSAHFDRDGRIWLQWSSRPGTPGRLWILNSDGEAVLALTAPKSLDVLAIEGSGAIEGSWLWARETDSLDVPYLVRYRIREQ